MKILLIQPPWGDVYGSYKEVARIGNAYPPLGLCYLSAALKKKRWQTKIIDAEIEGKDIVAIVEEAQNYRPDVIGITATTPTYNSAKKVAKALKARTDVPIVLGGAHVTVMPDAISGANGAAFDYAVVGEGEVTLCELVACLERGQDTRNVRGVAFLESDGKLNVAGNRELIENLDELPFPDRESLHLDKYQWAAPGRGLTKFTTIMMSRGCPFKCIFCSAHAIFGRQLRRRKIDCILDEIAFIKNNFNINHLAFIDDVLTVDHKLILGLCEGLLERELNITWEGWTRANTFTEEVAQCMRKAGFVRVSFGIESGTPEILEVLKKGVTLEDISKAFEIAKKTGIETRGSVIIGNPFETREAVLKTFSFIKGLDNCDQMHINIATPYPGTELYDMAKKGEGGLRLLTDDVTNYKRYGDSVIEVNDLSKEDLIELQRKGFMEFYFTPKRILYNLRRAGVIAGMKNALAFLRSVVIKGRL